MRPVSQTVRPAETISIHASRMGCDGQKRRKALMEPLFQSTHPVWDATGPPVHLVKRLLISIHASRMGCDLRQGRGRRHPQISIHASRMGCDCNHCGPASWPSYFNPRIPYGMRLFDHSVLNDAGIFQSTHPVWDATSVRALLALRPLISIHASRMGCDAVICHCRPLDCDFNPRIPYGMRRWTVPSSVFSVLFQSTHPVWDATVRSPLAALIDGFQSTHPVWDATWAFFDWGLDPAFQSTHPVWDATWEQHESDCHG